MNETSQLLNAAIFVPRNRKLNEKIELTFFFFLYKGESRSKEFENVRE
jgi:hypothetical protein